MQLTILTQQFFDQYLYRIKGVRENTAKAYRDTFLLFLPFAAQYLHIHVKSLVIKHLSSDLVLAFLDHLEINRQNKAQTRNQRLAALKSFCRMIKLLYSENKMIAEGILNIPKKRAQKTLIGYLTPEEIIKIFNTVDLRQKEGFRDYTILHLLSDSGARASEVAELNQDYFNPQNMTLSILGKGNRFRQIELTVRTTELIKRYIESYRPTPKPLYQNRLFINQRGEGLTRHGIYRMCQKYLHQVLSEKRLKGLNPVHSFRHSCAVNMLASGKDIVEIKNRLGHEKLETTMIYLKLDLPRKRQVQKEFMEYTQSSIENDSKINELIDWENKEKTLAWLDSL
ncbi:MAG: integrase [Bdellovibrionales bacterium RIFOXYC12_FULL_39_17]|nr:MAG: integrase [Bdellovibrionales bacterium RIFOXYC12_FULL_39_17]